jgi:peptidoglycan/LPS O-acetylase OafA/YrhL
MNAPAALKGRHHGIDVMRGLAALLVCAGHLRAAAMVDLGQAISPGLLTKALYALTSLGHQSVMVFFVLSGYLVGGSVLAAGPRFQWPSYAQARLSRLWTVLLPCLALTWAVDQWVLSAAPQLYDGSYATLWHSAPAPGQYDASWRTWLGNVFFLQTIAVPVFGSNGPLWSLANEFWYYVLFPLMLTLVLSRRSSSRLVAGLAQEALALGVLMLMPSDMRYGYLVWLMGAMAFWVQGRSPRRHAGLRALTLVLFMGAIGVSKWSATQAWAIPWGDLLLGAGTALLVAQASSSGPVRWPRWLKAAVERLSDLSFSLYLSHFPLVMLLGASAYLRERMQPGPASWGVFAVCLLALVACGHAVWWLFERHTPTVRRWLGMRLVMRPAS